MTFFEQFNADIKEHQMTVIRDDGVNRHIRFSRPNTGNMSFDLLTWPGYLCYTGDMGTYVFARLKDMFQFFRNDSGRVNLSYWSEKIQAADRDGVEQFCPKLFRERIKEQFDEFTEEWHPRDRDGLWDEVESDVLRQSNDGDVRAYDAAMTFEHDGDLVFQDFWEVNCREYTHRFQWCCHAIVWGIAQYDARLMLDEVVK